VKLNFKNISRALIFFVLLGATINSLAANNKAPNVILVLTDDQGIGDIGCHGNPWLKTPNLDKFYEESVRMTDFHVSSVCTPTRGAIMTGRYPINNGAWATYKGRDALSAGRITMADIFKANGYVTGMFGKWHLGDNYPSRPTDCGFDYVVQHKAGGVGELSDYWGNNYFNDTYFVNNEPKPFKGYCTDVWFQETMNFIDRVKDQDKPFFIYLPTNAPHGPHYVDPKYSEPLKKYEGTEIVSADFYGMIVNIDENFGKLEKYLKEKKLTDNTILIFMTDNGTHYGVSDNGKLGYNYGFRGKKGGKQEGSHRVPFFIRWKDGKISGGKDIDAETAHVDLIPTLASLCHLKAPANLNVDGIDFSSLLTNKGARLPERTIFVHNRQDWRPPTDVDKTCIIKNDWRLIDGTGLYDIEKDRMEQKDLSAQYPDVKKELLEANALFLKKTKANPEYTGLPVSIVGNDKQKVITLTIQHAIGEGNGIWQAEQVCAGVKNDNDKHAIEIEKAGVYQITCMRWPKECPGPMLGIPAVNPKNFFTYKTIKPEKVRISIANTILEKEIQKGDDKVTFKLSLEKGKTFLVTDFVEGNETYGVYYTYIEPVTK